jgi:alpha-N-arabinofuranosidase
MRHADRVKIACMAQLVNALAPIMTETGGTAWRQTIYYPFLHASRFGRGATLDTRISSPTYRTERFGEVAVLDAVATVDEENEELAIFAVNRSSEESIVLTADVRGFEGYSVEEHLVLDHADPSAANTSTAPETVVPRRGGGFETTGSRLTVELPRLSWNVIRLRKRPAG